MTSTDESDEAFWVYGKTPLGRLLEGLGWIWGWGSYLAARIGLRSIAEGMVDTAIVLRRSNRGAIRAAGYMNGLDGKLAVRRGWVLVEGLVGPVGPFANMGFFARHDVAARDEARALQLISRWERDVVPGSLKIAEAELNTDDSGAEGVLWVYPGRAYFDPKDKD